MREGGAYKKCIRACSKDFRDADIQTTQTYDTDRTSVVTEHVSDDLSGQMGNALPVFTVVNQQGSQCVNRGLYKTKRETACPHKLIRI